MKTSELKKLIKSELHTYFFTLYMVYFIGIFDLMHSFIVRKQGYISPIMEKLAFLYFTFSTPYQVYYLSSQSGKLLTTLFEKIAKQEMYVVTIWLGMHSYQDRMLYAIFMSADYDIFIKNFDHSHKLQFWSDILLHLNLYTPAPVI